MIVAVLCTLYSVYFVVFFLDFYYSLILIRYLLYHKYPATIENLQVFSSKQKFLSLVLYQLQTKYIYIKHIVITRIFFFKLQIYCFYSKKCNQIDLLLRESQIYEMLGATQ